MNDNRTWLAISLFVLVCMIIASISNWYFSPGFWIIQFLVWGYSVYAFGKQVLKGNY